MRKKDLSTKRLLARLEVLRDNVEKRKAACNAERSDKQLRKLLAEDKATLAVWEKELKQRQKKKGEG